jgi:RPA family protein
MENIIDREVAWRIFAFEFNRSNLYYSEGDERAPNYIITPTGVRCNRLFVVGVVTEIENIGAENNLWRARIADPTGVFTVYAGQYQPEAAIFLSELNVPAYVSVVGKARKYEPGDGSVYTSIRPEEINHADEKLRDRWVLDTAERTLERIRIMEDALSSGLSGNELKDYLLKKGTNAALADGAVRAIGHYKNLDRLLSELKNALVRAIETVLSERVKTGTPEMEKRQEPKASIAALNLQSGISTHVQQADALVNLGEYNASGSGSQKQQVEKPEEPQLDVAASRPPSSESTYVQPADERSTYEQIDGKIEQNVTEIKAGQEIAQEHAAEEAPAQIEPKEVLAGIIDKLDTGKGIPYAVVVETAISAGIDADSVEVSIKDLMDEGRCYEPKIGVLRKV